MNFKKLKPRFSRYWKTARSIRSAEDILNILKKLEQLAHTLVRPIVFTSAFWNVFVALPRIVFGLFLLTIPFRNALGMSTAEFQFASPSDLVLPQWLSWVTQDTLYWLDRIEHFVQGGMFIIGFNSRLLSAALLWIVLEQFITHTLHSSFSMILCLLFIFTCTYTIWIGSGKYGIDFFLSEKYAAKPLL